MNFSGNVQLVPSTKRTDEDADLASHTGSLLFLGRARIKCGRAFTAHCCVYVTNTLSSSSFQTGYLKKKKTGTKHWKTFSTPCQDFLLVAQKWLQASDFYVKISWLLIL